MDFEKRDNPGQGQSQYKQITLESDDAAAVLWGLDPKWENKCLSISERYARISWMVKPVIDKLGHGNSLLQAISNAKEESLIRCTRRNPGANIYIGLSVFFNALNRSDERETIKYTTFYGQEADVAVKAIRNMAENGSNGIDASIMSHAEALVEQLDA